MGVPTVAFDSFGALHDIIVDGSNGRIVPNNNLIAFQNALNNLLLNDDLRKQMSINAVEKGTFRELASGSALIETDTGHFDRARARVLIVAVRYRIMDAVKQWNFTISYNDFRCLGRTIVDDLCNRTNGNVRTT